MSDPVVGELVEREFNPAESGAVAMLNKSELDTQITTARKFPRSVTAFVGEATGLVSLNEEVAGECVYALTRGDKTIEGPSARLAEILAYSWGNCRSTARVVDDTGDFVTAQGVHWDIQKNVTIGYEVKRRIVDKHGKRFNADMIGVTSNAACSIALRNAILKGIPKAIWAPIYETARRTIMGDFKTLASRRETTLERFLKFGVKPEQVYEKLGIKGSDDITLDHILVLRGLLTALKEGDATVENEFPAKTPPSDKSATSKLKTAVGAQGGAQAEGDTTPPAQAGSAQDAPKAPAGEAEKAQSKEKPGKQPKAPEKGEQGTPEVLAKCLAKMNASASRDTLDLARDEATFFIWTMDDVEKLDQAYRARLEDLKS